MLTSQSFMARTTTIASDSVVDEYMLKYAMRRAPRCDGVRKPWSLSHSPTNGPRTAAATANTVGHVKLSTTVSWHLPLHNPSAKVHLHLMGHGLGICGAQCLAVERFLAQVLGNLRVHE
jgi:hypothetical protein